MFDYEPALRSFTIVNRLKKDDSVTKRDPLSSTLGLRPTCNCRQSKESESLPLDVDARVTAFGQSLTKTANSKLCARAAAQLFDAQHTKSRQPRDAETLVQELSSTVSDRIKVRFEQVKSLAKKFEALLKDSPVPSPPSLVPCCEFPKGCETCRLQNLFSDSIPVDLARGCLRYPALVSASALDGRKDIPAVESSGQSITNNLFPDTLICHSVGAGDS